MTILIGRHYEDSLLQMGSPKQRGVYHHAPGHTATMVQSQSGPGPADSDHVPVKLTTPEHFLSNTQWAMIMFQIMTYSLEI